MLRMYQVALIFVRGSNSVPFFGMVCGITMVICYYFFVK